MPHISQKKLDPKHLGNLQRELIRSFERASMNIKTTGVFHEFFTRTEKIMFAKRLAVISMLQKGISHYMISQALGMSPSTIERLALRYEQGKYEHLIKEALGKKDIWTIIENILYLDGIMPPKYGQGRWRMLDRQIYKNKLKKS